MCRSCGDHLDTRSLVVLGTVPELFCAAEPLVVRGFAVGNGDTFGFCVTMEYGEC